ncbi:MAG: hypothetical protein LBI67_03910 [Treponema sp.]|jgi:hypothetical protein|nr:hypothetical protein [Treponema sp.]
MDEAVRQGGKDMVPGTEFRKEEEDIHRKVEKVEYARGGREEDASSTLFILPSLQ